MTMNYASSLCMTESVRSNQSTQSTFSRGHLLDLESLLESNYGFATLRWCQKWSLATLRRYRSQNDSTITSEHFPWPVKPLIAKQHYVRSLPNFVNPVSQVSKQHATTHTTRALALGKTQYRASQVLAINSLRNCQVTSEQPSASCYAFVRWQTAQTASTIDTKERTPLSKNETPGHRAPRRNRANSLFIRQYALDCHARNVSYTLPPKSGIQADDKFCRAYLGRHRLRQFHQKHNIFRISEMSREKLCKCCVLPPRQDQRPGPSINNKWTQRHSYNRTYHDDSAFQISHPILTFTNGTTRTQTIRRAGMLTSSAFTRDIVADEVGFVY